MGGTVMVDRLVNSAAASLGRKALQCIIGVCMAALRRNIPYLYISAN